MPMDAEITIIVPSRGLQARLTHLLRAVESIRSQQGVRAIPMVVLNGALCSPEVESALHAIEELQLIVVPTEGIPGALRAGRAAVGTRWFGTLDDDDVLMPGSLAMRVDALRSSGADVVVTNGFRRLDGVDRLHVPAKLNVGSKPLRAFRKLNWFLPGSWLARSDRVDASIFDDMPPYRECTYLALRFATGFRMHWLQEPTVIYHEFSPHAESTSWHYFEGQLDASRALLSLDLPASVRRQLRWDIAALLHDHADRHYADGALDQAWEFHIRSLVSWCGFRFLPFTRHLVSMELRRAMQRVRSTSP
jgi:hypothetical protein